MELLDFRDPAALDQPVVRARYSLHLVELLAEEGVAASRVLAGTGLSRSDLTGREPRITYAQQLGIYRNAATHSRHADLGFRLGLRQRISDHGVFGYAIQSSADLSQALRILVRYQETTGPLMQMTVAGAGGPNPRIELREVLPLGEIGRMAREEVLAVLLSGLLGSTGPPTRPSEIRIDLPARFRREFEARLDAPLRFDSEVTAICLEAADLTRPLVFSDEETASVCEQRCREVLERLSGSGDLVAELRRTLLGTPGQFPSLDKCASTMGMSGRTLRRRLTEVDASYQSVLRDVRLSLALDYLQRSNLGLDEIAFLLGYTETPNFYRAFRKWTGQPPSAFRRQAE